MFYNNHIIQFGEKLHRVLLHNGKTPIQPCKLFMLLRSSKNKFLLTCCIIGSQPLKIITKYYYR